MDITVAFDPKGTALLSTENLRYDCYVASTTVWNWRIIANVRNDAYIFDCISHEDDDTALVQIVMDAAQISQLFDAIAEQEGL